jgi:hypothetical protein
MAKFMIEFPHTTLDCVYTLHDLAEKSPDIFARMNWGCMVNKHNGWGFVEAENIAEVKSMLPPDLDEKATITLVTQYSAGDLESMAKRL